MRLGTAFCPSSSSSKCSGSAQRKAATCRCLNGWANYLAAFAIMTDVEVLNKMAQLAHFP